MQSNAEERTACLLITADLLDKCLRMLERILNECLIGWFEQFKDDLIQRLKSTPLHSCSDAQCSAYSTLYSQL